ncbi:hypothetical protein B0I21_102315 [Sphingobacterium paludis]|uniref:Uncharacterized protein n=1 Tax=Sphingobacterium paludis TaxID=1476465 RepID=A0A4R7D4I1_9SPHI|nr:hypothetical protein B0I21_102315 [Sphingobacterium paludis]
MGSYKIMEPLVKNDISHFVRLTFLQQDSGHVYLLCALLKNNGLVALQHDSIFHQ